MLCMAHARVVQVSKYDILSGLALSRVVSAKQICEYPLWSKGWEYNPLLSISLMTMYPDPLWAENTP